MGPDMAIATLPATPGHLTWPLPRKRAHGEVTVQEAFGTNRAIRLALTDQVSV